MILPEHKNHIDGKRCLVETPGGQMGPKGELGFSLAIEVG